MRHTILVLALMLLAGCATTFRPWMLSEVEEGMDKAQVIQLLGEPDSSEVKDGAEYLYYTYQENYNPPLTEDNILAPDASGKRDRDRLKRGFKESHYVVKLVDGKVQDYKEVTE